MKTVLSFLFFFSTVVLMNGLIPSEALATIGNFKSVYICGTEISESLLNEEDFESVVGYFPKKKDKVFMAAGWPGLPRRATIVQNTEDLIQIEGLSYTSSAFRLTIQKDTSPVQIGSEKYPVAQAINEMNVMGSISQKELFCIYFPKNDNFSNEHK